MSVWSKKIIKRRIIVLLVLIMFFMISTFLVLNHNSNDNNTDVINGVPTLKISLNGVTQEEINSNSKEIKYKNNKLEIINNDIKTLTKSITIKGRGNVTWQYLKKPYQISFDEEINLFNLGKSEKWVLLANYFDETLIRNHIAFYIADKLDMQFTPKGISVNLYIDDEYQGVYYITPKIGITPASVNIENKESIVMELDNTYYMFDDDYYLTKYEQDHFVLKDVKNKKYKKKAVNNFINTYNKFEDALNNNNWENINKLIDVESFAKYYVLNTLVQNADGYLSSFYMYQNGKKDKIHAGPIWDFDIAFSSKAIANDYFVKANTVFSLPKDNSFKNGNFQEPTQIMTKLLEYPEFRKIVKRIWDEKCQNILDDIFNEVNLQYKLLIDDANRNIVKWNYPNKYDNIIVEFKNNIEELYKYTNYIITETY